MTKENLMEHVRGYILEGSFSWEDVCAYIVWYLHDFSTIQEKHLLSPNEFIFVLSFFEDSPDNGFNR